MANGKMNDYRDLEVWQRGRQIAKMTYLLTKSFPKEELYGMTSQMRRASTSIPANIAEGWGRHYPAEFIQFLRTANGSRTELETHLTVCTDVGLCEPEEAQPLIDELIILGKQLVSLERSLKRRSQNQANSD